MAIICQATFNVVTNVKLVCVMIFVSQVIAIAAIS